MNPEPEFINWLNSWNAAQWLIGIFFGIPSIFIIIGMFVLLFQSNKMTSDISSEEEYELLQWCKNHPEDEDCKHLLEFYE